MINEKRKWLPTLGELIDKIKHTPVERSIHSR